MPYHTMFIDSYAFYNQDSEVSRRLRIAPIPSKEPWSTWDTITANEIEYNYPAMHNGLNITVANPFGTADLGLL